jgi:hypothetical protein
MFFFILSSFWAIKKAMGVPTNDLQHFFKIQMQLDNDKII